MKPARRPRSRNKWNFKNPRMRTPFANPDRSGQAPPHLQFISQDFRTSPPARQDASSLMEGARLAMPPGYFDQPPSDSGAFPSLTAQSTTTQQLRTSGTTGLVLEDGEEPRSHGGVSLEDFIRVDRRGNRDARVKQAQPGFKGDSTAPRAISNTPVETREASHTLRRLAPAPEFIPSARRNPITPQHPRPPGMPTMRTDPQPLRSAPRSERYEWQGLPQTDANTSLPDPVGTSGAFFEIPTQGGGIFIYQKELTYDQHGNPFETWKPFGEVKGEHMDSLLAFRAAANQIRGPDGEFDQELYEAHKLEAIRQMCEDGQIDLVKNPAWTPLSEPLSGSHTRTPAAPPGLHISPQQLRQASAQHLLNRTPTRSTYNPVALQEAYQEGATSQYDPFVSPHQEREQQRELAIYRAMRAAQRDKMTWQEENLRRNDEVLQQRQKAVKSLATQQHGVLTATQQSSVAPQNATRRSQAGRDEPRRTVLHDPFQNPQPSETVAPHSDRSSPESSRHQPGVPQELTQPKHVRQAQSQASGLAQDMRGSAKEELSLSRATTAYGYPEMYADDHQEYFPAYAQTPSQHHQQTLQPAVPPIEGWPQALPPGHAKPVPQMHNLNPLLQPPKTQGQYLDPNKTEYELRNPFSYKQTGEPPFFTDDFRFERALGLHPETAEQKSDRIWSSAWRFHQDNQHTALEYAKSTGQGGNPEAVGGSMLLIPLAENLKHYEAQAKKKRMAEQQRWNDRWENADRGPQPLACDYLTKQYDPMGVKFSDMVAELLVPAN